MTNKALRESLGKKPDHFFGTKYQFKKIISSLLLVWNKDREWVLNKRWEWEL